MTKLLYSARDIAYIINDFDLSESISAELIHKLWNEEKIFLQPEYRQNYRKWFLDIRCQSNYIHDPAIQKDCDGLLECENFLIDDFKLNLFFKSLRIKILYIGEKNYYRMKLRTLLSKHGYKRRTKELVAYLKKCLAFYHIQTNFHGEICDVAEIKLDDMITFRVL